MSLCRQIIEIRERVRRVSRLETLEKAAIMCYNIKQI